MTPKQRRELIVIVKRVLTKFGYKEDRWGNYVIEKNGTKYRMKFTKIALRFERKTPYGWKRIRSNYYKNVSISDQGRISGLTF